MNQLRTEDVSPERAELGGSPESGEVSREVKEQARKLETSARERVVSIADEKRKSVAKGLLHLADRVEEASHDPENGKEVEYIAGYMVDVTHRVADVLKTKNSEEILELTKRGMREHPGLSMAGFFALGFLGARLLRE